MLRFAIGLLLGLAGIAFGQSALTGAGPNIANTGNILFGQVRITGLNAGIDIDADSIFGLNGIGLIVESGVPSPVVGPTPAFINIISGKAATQTSASLLLQTNTSVAPTDPVIAMGRRSFGSFGAESATQTTSGTGCLAGLNNPFTGCTGVGTGTVPTVLFTAAAYDWKSGSGMTAIYDNIYAFETYPSENRSAGHYGTTFKEYLNPTNAEGVQVVRYMDGTGSTQLPFNLMVGGGTNIQSPLAALHVYNTAGAGTPAANEVVQIESPALSATKNPRLQLYQGKLTRTNATPGTIVSFNSNTGSSNASVAANTGRDNVYLVTAYVTGLCTTAGADCAVGQGGAWKKTTVCVNTAGTLTCGGTVATTDDFSADNLTTHLATPVSIAASTETINVSVTSNVGGTMSFGATVEIRSGRI